LRLCRRNREKIFLNRLQRVSQAKATPATTAASIVIVSHLGGVSRRESFDLNDVEISVLFPVCSCAKGTPGILGCSGLKGSRIWLSSVMTIHGKEIQFSPSASIGKSERPSPVNPFAWHFQEQA
jgi:hypothetical protein